MIQGIRKMLYRGGCHCGVLGLEFESEVDPAGFAVRECQCSFCRKHRTRAIADPEGKLVVRVGDAGDFSRYTFGLETAEYLLCRRCGVYVAALTLGDPQPRGLVILNALDERERFTKPPVPSVYDAETREERRIRRRTTWTPASVIVGS